jgi:hypothetical protein
MAHPRTSEKQRVATVIKRTLITKKTLRHSIMRSNRGARVQPVWRIIDLLWEIVILRDNEPSDVH